MQTIADDEFHNYNERNTWNIVAKEKYMRNLLDDTANTQEIGRLLPSQ